MEVLKLTLVNETLASRRKLLVRYYEVMARETSFQVNRRRTLLDLAEATINAARDAIDAEVAAEFVVPVVAVEVEEVPVAVLPVRGR